MSQEESATITETENITKTSPETENVPKETKNEQIEQTDQNKSEPQSENQTSTKNDVQENQQENQTEEQKKDVFEQTPLNSNFPGEPNFFPQMGEMFGEPGAIPEMQQQNIPNYAFAEGNENTSLFPGSFGQNFQGQIPQTDENFSYGVGSPQMGEAGANIDMMAAANPQMYQDMAQVIPRGEFSSVSQPDSKLCPARLSQEELQRELGARGLVYSEDDQVANIARLVNYLVDREYVFDLN
ncbi:hypothetical protein MHBO_003750 [Bonamia ostreae]|uniref:Uncharacterized protein n=1 Tax=Bonamia ostreae TaxID=126728 RepID=A0ABV2ARE6_9EUKA